MYGVSESMFGSVPRQLEGSTREVVDMLQPEQLCVGPGFVIGEISEAYRDFGLKVLKWPM